MKPIFDYLTEMGGLGILLVLVVLYGLVEIVALITVHHTVAF